MLIQIEKDMSSPETLVPSLVDTMDRWRDSIIILVRSVRALEFLVRFPRFVPEKLRYKRSVIVL